MTSPSTSTRAPWPAAISVPLRLVYGIYAALVFLSVTLVALVGVVLLPSLRLRRATARVAARTFFLLAGMPVRLEGRENLPAGQCVVVANHASYLDGVVMTAALPPRFGFVIKREMNDVPLAGLLLRRIGSEFVERFNRHKGGTDARRVLRTATSGHSLVFFPEGTFTTEVGLGKFHTGAFAIAAYAACPVVPAVILGTRRNMPATRILPRPGPIEVRYGTPIPPVAAADTDPALALRDASRAAILEQLGEPDLCTGTDG
ncbi:MAG TPA: lysophospholipid acyltransferase family protein [Steroidobacteraceae bacterium]|jgi:1-acyl-sn-glycerol-3-phosphate acyltransferase|nr:lysophospholipid acyltransferase family protein [Steroidobacteraceae bacterium]